MASRQFKLASDFGITKLATRHPLSDCLWSNVGTFRDLNMFGFVYSCLVKFCESFIITFCGNSDMYVQVHEGKLLKEAVNKNSVKTDQIRNLRQVNRFLSSFASVCNYSVSRDNVQEVEIMGTILTRKTIINTT